jgi:predicted nuclease with TOPRIM domain
MFRTITKLTRQFIPKTGALKGKNGELTTEKDKILERWKEYTAELYKTNEQLEELNGSTYEKELWILKSEVRWALDQLPYNRAPGCDNTQIELLKAIKEEVIPAMTILCNEVWEKAKWPRKWKQMHQ